MLFYAIVIPCLFLLIWCCLAGPRRGHPKWKILRRFRYAHRGFHDKPRIPENSLPAFRRAVERGFGAELDVHLTRDGRLAVIHDSALRRVCGVDGRVEQLTAAELSAFRLEGTEERIPFLEEVLPMFEGRTPLVVELKPDQSNWNELAERTIACLDRYQVDYCVESFDPRALMWLKRHRPEIVRGQLTQNFFRHPSGQGAMRRFVLTNLLLNFLTRPDFIACRFEDRRCVGPWLVCGPLGGWEFNWTIRSRSDLELAEREGHLVIFETFDPEAPVVSSDGEQPREARAQEFR
jgi:glycerophosphoryl diester phosphodiesterase